MKKLKKLAAKAKLVAKNKAVRKAFWALLRLVAKVAAKRLLDGLLDGIVPEGTCRPQNIMQLQRRMIKGLTPAYASPAA